MYLSNSSSVCLCLSCESGSQDRDQLFVYILLGLVFVFIFVCVCVEVVNGSVKRGIGLLGGNEGAQLLTLRSAGGEQRLNRTEIHLSI